MKQKRTLSIITGILFVLVAFLTLKRILPTIQLCWETTSSLSGIYFLSQYYYPSLPYSVLDIIGYVIIAVALFRTKPKNVLLLIGLAICTLANIFIGNIWAILAWILAIVFATPILTDRIPKLAPIVKKLYFIPAVLSAVFMYIYAQQQCVFYYFERYSIIPTHIISEHLAVVALFGLMAINWVSVREKKQKEKNTGDAAVASELYYSLGKHVLLLLFTCGVWMYIWIYKTTKHTNAVKGEDYRNPTNKLLLCLFVPFYSIYWTYKTAQRIDKMANEKGISSDMSTLCLILAIFVPIIPPILLQDKLNAIATADPSHVAKPDSASELGVADELKKYKELLDSDVITQEEFDAKKKQLLGL